MVQLVINGIALPETSNDKYSCYPTKLGDRIEMISGRIVEEYRGEVMRINYAYDYMGNEQMRQLLTALRSTKPIEVAYLPDGSETMVASYFVVESLTNPTFAFSKMGVPYWHNLKFTLREAEPHD